MVVVRTGPSKTYKSNTCEGFLTMTSFCISPSKRGDVGYSQRAHYTLITEYILNHNIKAPIILRYILGIELSGFEVRGVLV